MRFGLRLLAFTIIALVLPAGTYALTWEKKSADIEMPAGQGQVVVQFPFKNESSLVVNIRDLQSYCGCSSPTVKSRVIQPGESGIVSVVYTAGERVGRHKARLTIITDEPEAKPTELLLNVNIEAAVSIVPKIVRWEQGGSGATFTVQIRQLGKTPVRLLSAEAKGENIAAELTLGATQGTWDLTLTPVSVEEKSTTCIQILGEVDGRKLTYSVFGVVR